ncbi:MAG TPA: F0F1 ATP synthase subunit A [Saprospiraceae bacterium]|nr:F0F1 ATP synthase subunit A [Saprospiraceae bacterium]
MHKIAGVLLIFCLTVLSATSLAQNHSHDHHDNGHDHSHEQHVGDEHHADDHEGHHDNACGGHGDHGGEYDPKATAMHHISDANVYTILDAVRIPLPCILYAKDKGWDVFMSSKFEPGHHDNGHAAYNGYVLHEGAVKRVIAEEFPSEGQVHVGGFTHEKIEVDGKERSIGYVCYEGEKMQLEEKTVFDGGVLGGAITSFYDLSITKNVASMILILIIFFFIFRWIARAYQNGKGKAPRGIQSLLEPVILYIRDEVAIPFLGRDRYAKYMPLLLSIFFFILGLNLWGQVPFLGGTNVTGSLTVTMVLAILVFLIVNFSGNKHYWQHILWMPGVPVAVKPLLAVIELMSMFIKPLTLMLRLAGNITAGHIAILSFIGLIFIFGDSGQNMTGGTVGSVLSVALTLFMMAIELIVAFIQAYVFTILSASYIGAAIEEHH